MRIQVIIGAVILCLVAVLGLAYMVNSSLWVMWHLLPSNHDQRTFAVAVNRGFKERYVFDLIQGSKQYIPPDIQAYMAISKNIAWTHSEEQGDVLTLTVSPWKISSIARTMRGQGWQVEHIGTVIRASKSSDSSTSLRVNPIPSLTQAVSNALRSITTYSYPLNPFIIAEIPPFSGLSEPIFGVATVVGSRIDISVQNGTHTHTFVTPASFSAVPKGENALGLIIPGSILKNVPVQIRNNLTQDISKKFGFVKKQPAIIDAILNYQKILIYMDSSGVAVGVYNDRFFSDIAHNWLKEEERRYHIQKQPFTLPDGTRGYEYVPAEAQVVLKQDIQHPHCYTTLDGPLKTLPAFVCTTQMYTFLTTSPNLLDTFPLLATDEYYVHLGEEWISTLGLRYLQSAHIYSKHPWTHLELKLSPR